MLNTLNILIGLVCVLLLLSLLATAIMEVLAAMLSLRGKHLRFTLETMLDEKVDDFLRHPFFRQLSYATERRTRLSPYSLPAKVNTSTFRDIVLDLMRPENGETMAQKINNLPEGELKRMLSFLYRQADGNYQDFGQRLENWYDQVMERASDWYKRATKWWLFGVGLVLACVLNADTIAIYQNLSTNDVARNYLIQVAEQQAAQPLPAQGQVTSLEDALNKAAAIYDSDIQPLRSPLGLGWRQPMENDFFSWLVKLTGLLLTAIAVTLGAPFWYDLLRKMIAVRGSSQSAPPSTPPAGQPVREPLETSRPASAPTPAVPPVQLPSAPDLPVDAEPRPTAAVG